MPTRLKAIIAIFTAAIALLGATVAIYEVTSEGKK